MKAHEDVARYIEEWDEEVLQYIADIDVAYTHEQQVREVLQRRLRDFAFENWGCATLFVPELHAALLALQGFRIDFIFNENPFFTNLALAQVGCVLCDV